MLISESQSSLIQLLRHPLQPPSPSWDGTGQFVIRSWIWRHAVETDVWRYPGVCSEGVCVCVYMLMMMMQVCGEPVNDCWAHDLKG